MKGQWVGKFNGTNSGSVIIDLDEEEKFFTGHIFAFDDDANLASTVASIRTKDKGDFHEIETSDVAAIHPQIPVLISKEKLNEEFPGLAFPSSLKLELALKDDGIHGKWQSNIGTSGEALLPRSQCDEESKIKVREDVKNWNEFRDFALSLPYRQFIFRGQDVCKKLRTSFHRTRRKDLVRYITQDVPELRLALSPKISHQFDLHKSEENAAFLNLLQHHGFPTPLLDWTHSPFVAAFFAYRSQRKRDEGDDKVRVFIFDRDAWIRDWYQVQSIILARPHFSILQALSIENQRAMPQQALLSATNMDDIEAYIASKELEGGKVYLQAVDLPFSERRKVMEDLSLMGVTAGSLFPGLDGTCEELAGRFFHPVS